MATWEMQLLSRVIRTGDLNGPLAWGVGVDDFLTSEGRGIFNVLTGYAAQPGTVGSVVGINALTQVFPNFVLCDDSSMTTEALCYQTRRDRLNVQLKYGTSEAMALIDSDPMQAAQVMSVHAQNVMALGYSQTTDVRLAVGAHQVMNQYLLKKQGVDLSVGKWPWQILNDETGGIQKDDYFVFFGRPKSYKTWMLVCCVASLIMQNKRVMVYTKEMTWEEMMERIMACLAIIRHWNLRHGCLSPTEERSFSEMCTLVQSPIFSDQCIILSGKDTKGNDTIPWIQSKIDSHKPHILAIDGIHLMADAHRAKKREERITNISRDARQMIISTGIPIVGTVQANRGAAKHNEANSEDVAYSDAISQDVTGLFRTIKDKRENLSDPPTASIVCGLLRNGDIDGFRINAHPAVDFTFHSKLSAIDALNAQESDAKAAEEEAKQKRKKNGQVTENQAAQAGQRMAQHTVNRHAQAS
jgi:replicative DNA helicase